LKLHLKPPMFGGDLKGKELVRSAYIAKYGIDLKKACAIDSVHFWMFNGFFSNI
jgi:hypothetical protein